MILEINIGKIEYEVGLKWERNNWEEARKVFREFYRSKIRCVFMEI